MPKPPPTDVTFTFSERLKKYRELSRFKSAAAFARELNVEEHTYRQWERGDREPSLDIICKMSDILSITIDDLVRGPRR